MPTVTINWHVTGTYDFFGLNYYTARSVKSLLSLNDVAKSEYSYVNVTVSTKSSTVAPLFEVKMSLCNKMCLYLELPGTSTNKTKCLQIGIHYTCSYCTTHTHIHGNFVHGKRRVNHDFFFRQPMLIMRVIFRNRLSAAKVRNRNV
jgi:hypothetical protein